MNGLVGLGLIKKETWAGIEGRKSRMPIHELSSDTLIDLTKTCKFELRIFRLLKDRCQFKHI